LKKTREKFAKYEAQAKSALMNNRGSHSRRAIIGVNSSKFTNKKPN